MTIAEIKKTMTDAFIADETIKSLYKLQSDKSFDEQFSVVSLENIIFFITATAMWITHSLFDQLKVDVLEILRSNKAHTANWYATRSMDFQYGHDLIPDTDEYDNTGLTDEEIENSKIVKFAAAVEAVDKSILYVKVATESDGNKQPLSALQLTAFKYYLNSISDAGVRISVINDQPDEMRLHLDIYYDPLVLDKDGKRLDGTENTPVQNAIKNYLKNLPFNGTYTNQSLVDTLQVLEGVNIAELKSASSRYGVYTEYTEIDAREIPHAGYYTISDENLILRFIPNEKIL